MQLAEFKNKLGKLRVAANHHYLEYDDGTPFSYLGDTAWLLFHRLNHEEAQHYLSNRAASGACSNRIHSKSWYLPRT